MSDGITNLELNEKEITDHMNGSKIPDFSSFSDNSLIKILEQYGLKKTGNTREEKISLLSKTWNKINNNLSKELYNKLFESIRNYDPEEEIITIIIQLLERNPQKLGEQNADENNNTPLIFACLNSYEDIALELIHTGYSNPGSVDGDGFTALMTSCYNGLNDNTMEDVALELLKTGQSNIALKSQTGETALMLACYGKLENVVLEMLKPENLTPEVLESIESVDTKDGNTALIIACENGMNVVALRIIETGFSNPNAVLNNDRYTKRKTAFILACENGLLDVASRLFDEDCLPTHIDYDNKSALYYLIEKKYIDSDIFRKLVKHYVLEEPTNQHFQTVIAIKICDSLELKELVKQTFASDSEMQMMNIEDFCKKPTQADAISANGEESLADVVNIREDHPLFISRREANAVKTVIADEEVDPFHYIASDIQGQLIRKRPMGGKTRRKNKKNTNNKKTAKKHRRSKRRTNQNQMRNKSKKSKK